MPAPPRHHFTSTPSHNDIAALNCQPGDTITFAYGPDTCCLLGYIGWTCSLTRDPSGNGMIQDVAPFTVNKNGSAAGFDSSIRSITFISRPINTTPTTEVNANYVFNNAGTYLYDRWIYTSDGCGSVTFRHKDRPSDALSTWSGPGAYSSNTRFTILNASATEAPSSHPTPLGTPTMKLVIISAYTTTLTTPNATSFTEKTVMEPKITQVPDTSTDDSLRKDTFADLVRKDPTLPAADLRINIVPLAGTIK